MYNNNNINPNNVNGTLDAISVESVAFGRSDCDQQQIGRQQTTDPLWVAGQAHTDKPATGSFSRPPSYRQGGPFRYKERMHNMFGQPVSNFMRYYTVKSRSDAKLNKLNIFSVDKEVHRILNGEPRKIDSNTDGTITIEVATPEQGERLLKATKLLNEEIIVEKHQRYNQSEGVIICEMLQNYSEEDILEGLKEKGVKKVFRFKKKIDKELKNTNALLLTFDSYELPDRLKLRPGYFVRVRPYFPLPKRCFKCQKYGHVGKFCRNKISTCVDCGQDSHSEEPCAGPTRCVNCGEEHPASSRNCDRYLLEKEIIAIKIKEKINFKEAREKALDKFIRPGTTFAAVLRRSGPSRSSVKENPSKVSGDAPAASPDRISDECMSPTPQPRQKRPPEEYTPEKLTAEKRSKNYDEKSLEPQLVPSENIADIPLPKLSNQPQTLQRQRVTAEIHRSHSGSQHQTNRSDESKGKSRKEKEKQQDPPKLKQTKYKTSPLKTSNRISTRKSFK